MKKLILKTALITLGVTIILAIASFGIISFCAPAAMMRFTASLGMESISGDYAYQEYERSGDIECLARSFAIAAENKENRTANERFETLYGEEGSSRRQEFEEFCKGYKVDSVHSGVDVSYRDYLTGLAAGVKYRLAKTEEAVREACAFALDQTENFTAGCPAVALALEIVEKRDGKGARELLGGLRSSGYEGETYTNIVKFLEEIPNE